MLQTELGGHGPQSMLSRVPHVALALFRTQTPLQRWYPLLQSATQRVPLQVYAPLARLDGQAWQVLPQEAVLVLLFCTQVRFGGVPQA